MTHKEQLKEHLQKLSELKNVVKKAQEDWVAYNKAFNDWMQKTLQVEESKGEMHLAEILTIWDGLK